MIYMGMKRHEMQAALEADLKRIAETMVVEEDPGEGDLKQARTVMPGFFGGLFPTMATPCDGAEGESKLVDHPDRPAVLFGRIMVVERAIPLAGVYGFSDDNTEPAKIRTRAIRGEYLDRVFKDPKLGPYFEAGRSTADRSDFMGDALIEEGNTNILWVDLTEYRVYV